MNMAEKRELLEAKKKELEKIAQAKAELAETVKSAKDDELDEVTKEVCEATEKSLKAVEEVKALEDEIKAEEEKLKEIAETATKNILKKDEKQMNYLKTKESLTDFAKVLQKTGGGEVLRKAWGEFLVTKGISNPEVLLPQAVISAITDAFARSGGIFATFRYTGLTMLKIAVNTNVTDATARAKGHKKGVAKGEQVITLTPKEIRAQYIYKYITIDKETIRETRDTGAVVRYVLEELPQRIVMEIERASMIGDGRASDADDKISSYETITRATGDNFVSVQAQTANGILSDLVNMDATITAEGSRYLVVSRATLASIKLFSNDGGLVFPIGSDIASALGYTAIFTPDWMTVEGAPVAIEYVGEAYKTVGDNTMDSYENFLLSQNKNEYLMEIYSGGGLDTMKSAAVLTVAAKEE